MLLHYEVVHKKSSITQVYQTLDSDYVITSQNLRGIEFNLEFYFSNLTSRYNTYAECIINTCDINVHLLSTDYPLVSKIYLAKNPYFMFEIRFEYDVTVASYSLFLRVENELDKTVYLGKFNLFALACNEIVKYLHI